MIVRITVLEHIFSLRICGLGGFAYVCALDGFELALYIVICLVNLLFALYASIAWTNLNIDAHIYGVGICILTFPLRVLN